VDTLAGAFLSSSGVSDTARASSLRTVDDVPDLEVFFNPSVNVVTLRRTPTAGLVDEARRVVTREEGFQRLFTLVPGAARSTMEEELAEFPRLADDILSWVDLVTDLTDAKLVGVRLTRATSAMCPRFHTDRVTVRLVTTYAGLGTEFVATQHADRGLLGHAAAGVPDEESGLLLKPDCIRQADPFDVVFLKGEAWPGNAGRGAVHRSPEASPSAPRLVLTLAPL